MNIISQIVFTVIFTASIVYFILQAKRLHKFIHIGKPLDRKDNKKQRLKLLRRVAFGQSKMFTNIPVAILHFILYLAFIIINIWIAEIVIDGIFGTDHVLKFLGSFYDVVMAMGDTLAILTVIACTVFLVRRNVLKVKRFTGVEMTSFPRTDANLILIFEIVIMLAFMFMNAGYIQRCTSTGEQYAGIYPFSSLIAQAISSMTTTQAYVFEKINWWIHILGILLFLNYLPKSKHIHIFLAFFNVYYSRLTPKGKLNTMPEITDQVKAMIDPNHTPADMPERLGVREVQDLSWKAILDAYTCTECGRCTSVCPANITGKLLSPRKIMMDIRDTVESVGDILLKNPQHHENTSLLDRITPEELWACTTCNACVESCPVNIDHVSTIIDMRRHLVMERSEAPSALNTMMSNIENNGAPWAFPPSDRFAWAEGLNIPTMADYAAQGKTPEVLFWVGCAGSFDDRYKRVTRSFAQILKAANIDFAVLGLEETCTGDPAKRAGNEFLAQMQAMTNIQTMNRYGVKKVVTACPHCFNTIKNEYPELGGNYEVMHHSEFINELFKTGRIAVKEGAFQGKKITFHDSCYLGRANEVYEAPREVLQQLDADLVEMKRSKQNGLCCGAGGAQMFKEAEKGKKEINIERTEEALALQPDIIAAACPFCMTMMTDGVKKKKFENEQIQTQVFDIAELVVQAELVAKS
ncbi:MAG: (Fe-S)-binding protein [Bacteroidia bacterium]|nr:(Fe-S)-binding protein [Bacteroidia bacterium]